MKNILTYSFIALLLISCGSRKVETKKKEVEVKAEAKEQVKTETVIDKVTDTSVLIEAEELVFEPVDPAKPIVFVKTNPVNPKVKDTTTVYNAKISTKKTREQSNIKEQVKEQQKQEKQVELKQEATIKEKVKQSDRKQSFAWIGWVLLAGFALWLIFAFGRKKKKND